MNTWMVDVMMIDSNGLNEHPFFESSGLVHDDTTTKMSMRRLIHSFI